jgi:ABC-2 type transport system ATP-binding protein
LQRIGMAQALINNPDVVFLDEPMSGLDPLGRKQMRDIIISLKDAGKTVFFNSHVLTEVELICNRVGILARGELICCGTLDEILAHSNGSYYVSGMGGDRDTISRWVDNPTFGERTWQGQLRGEPEEFFSTLRLIGGELLSLKQARMSLEEFFMEQMEIRGIHTSV